MPKLTLSADKDVIEKAKHLAEERGTSVSAMFSQFVRSASGSTQADKRSLRGLPPITRRLAGIAKIPADKSYRELIEESIMEKHGR